MAKSVLAGAANEHTLRPLKFFGKIPEFRIIPGCSPFDLCGSAKVQMLLEFKILSV